MKEKHNSSSTNANRPFQWVANAKSCYVLSLLMCVWMFVLLSPLFTLYFITKPNFTWHLFFARYQMYVYKYMKYHCRKHSNWSANKAIYHIIISICVEIYYTTLLTITFNQLDESNQQFWFAGIRVCNYCY